MKDELKRFMEDESGDTNFISIIIILGIVIVLAGVFVAFREQIVGAVKSVVSSFGENDLGTKASQTTP